MYPRVFMRENKKYKTFFIRYRNGAGQPVCSKKVGTSVEGMTAKVAADILKEERESILKSKVNLTADHVHVKGKNNTINIYQQKRRNGPKDFFYLLILKDPETGNEFFKLGVTDNICKRYKEHKKIFCSFKILDFVLFETELASEIEINLKKRLSSINNMARRMGSDSFSMTYVLESNINVPGKTELAKIEFLHEVLELLYTKYKSNVEEMDFDRMLRFVNNSKN